MIRTLGCLPALIRPPFRCSTVPLQARARNGTTTATLRVIYPATNLGPGRATQHVQRLHAAVTGAPVDRPDHVAEPASQFVGDVLGGEFPQAAEVEGTGPSGGAARGDEPDEQVLHDAPVVEQAFVGGVVHESPSVAAPSP